MSNATTTFKLQAFGTSSAFDPHIIDFSRDTVECEGALNNSGSQFLSNQIFDLPGGTFGILPDNQFYFALKPQTVSATVTELLFPVESIPSIGDPTRIQVAFFDFVPAGCDNGIEYGELKIIENSFTDYSIPIDTLYAGGCGGVLSVPLAPTVLGNTGLTYIGIKLICPNGCLLKVEQFESGVTFKAILGYKITAGVTNTDPLKTTGLITPGSTTPPPTLTSLEALGTIFLPTIWLA